jgi:hypothetical protein
MSNTAYVPGFEYDIFISYAQVDDTEEMGRKGWVSTFVELLRNRLARVLGRSDSCSIWFDRRRLGGEIAFTAEIEQSLKETAILLSLLSRGYFESPWCSRERTVFLSASPTFAAKYSRVFVVELDEIAQEQRPKEFSECLPFRFWTRGATEKYPMRLGEVNPAADTEYFKKLDSLARDLGAALVGLRQTAQRSQGQAPQTRGGANGAATVRTAATVRPEAVAAQGFRVYLAEPTDDLDSLWWEVREYLRQQKIRVLPEQELPRAGEALEKAVVENVTSADLFVQLLSRVAGRRANENYTHVSLQHHCAELAQVPLLMWRDPLLTEAQIEGVANASHQKLLHAAQAMEFEEFRGEVVRTLQRLRDKKSLNEQLERKKKEAYSTAIREQFIFVAADPKDRQAAKRIFETIRAQGYAGCLPITLEGDSAELKPEEVRLDFETNVRISHGTLVVYGDCPPTWVRGQLTQAQKMRYGPDSNRCELGVFLEPPPNPKEFYYVLPRLHVLRGWQEGGDEAILHPFLDAIAHTAEDGQQPSAADSSEPHQAAHVRGEAMTTPAPGPAFQFHVFLSHSSRDKPAVRDLKQRLVGESLMVWFDEDELRPGIPWQKLLEEAIRSSGSVAVLVGSDGVAPWENEEMEGALQLAVRDKRPVIPVLLPGAAAQPALPMFLSNRTWVDLRAGYTVEGLDRLVWGITGHKPDRSALSGAER